MKSRLPLLVTLLAIVVASGAGSKEPIQYENTKYRIKSISGLSTEEAERLVEKVQELFNPEDYIYSPDMLADVDGDGQDEVDYEYASVMVADVDGDSQEEAIVVVSLSWRGKGIVAVSRKQGEDYVLLDQISSDGSLGIEAVDLSGNGKQDLIVKSLTGGAKWGRYTLQVYQWDGRKLAVLWKGVITEGGFFFYNKHTIEYNTNTQVQFSDLNRDGILEIIRIGEFYESAWEKLPELEEAKLPELETRLFPDTLNNSTRIDFGEITSGYEAVCRFRETFFYDKEFGYYIQYKAHVIKDTETRETNILERIPIAAGARVGVLGVPSAPYIRFLSLDSPIFVVLPDSRIVPLNEQALERICQED